MEQSDESDADTTDYEPETSDMTLNLLQVQLSLNFINKTRMHSSRMRTDGSLTVSRSICLWHACPPLPRMPPCHVHPLPHMPPTTHPLPCMPTPPCMPPPYTLPHPPPCMPPCDTRPSPPNHAPPTTHAPPITPPPPYDIQWTSPRPVQTCSFEDTKLVSIFA